MSGIGRCFPYEKRMASRRGQPRTPQRQRRARRLSRKQLQPFQTSRVSRAVSGLRSGGGRLAEDKPAGRAIVTPDHFGGFPR